jgi:LuxR family transcriptional regulator, maltose regulon positive regulatory protein
MREVRTRPLLAAKMAPPDPGDVIARPRLFTHLDQAASRPVTLVVAPAGWGKTVLLTSWLWTSEAGRGSAWVTVEAGDRLDDLWTYVAPALPGGDRIAHRDLSPGDRDWLVHLAAVLAERPAPVTLVVDGAEQIAEAPFVSGLDYLVGHADGRLRLILAARARHVLPAHRWRLRGAVSELTTHDLAFTTAEVIELFAGHGHALPVDLAEQVRDRSEGWAAALRLAVLAFGEHPEPARLVAEFRGDLPAVAEYLADEVLSRLSPQAVAAFTRCAVEDQLSAGLVDAVTGGVDGAALLSDAARDTGFTVAVPGAAGTYRHHRMLADVFRSRLLRQPEPLVRDARRRAARWFADKSQPARALRHALAGHDWALAESLLHDRWRELVPSVELPGPAPPAPTPVPVGAYPTLALADAADRLAAGDPDAVDADLRLAGTAEHLVTGRHHPDTARIAAALRLGRAQLAGDAVQVGSAANRLLALAQPEPLGEPLDRGARGIARIASGTALLAAGRLAAAEAALADGVSDADAVGLPRLAASGMSRLAVVQALRGRLSPAADAARRALDRVDPDVSGERAPAYLALALVATERDRPDEALAHLAPARSSQDPLLAALTTLAEARCRCDRGDGTAAYRMVQAGRSRADRAIASPYVASCFAAAEAELRAAQGDPDAGRGDLHRRLDAQAETAGLLAVALARLHLRANEPHAVTRLLAGWADRDDDAWPLPVRLAAGVLEAEAARRLADRRGAARIVEQVLALAAPEGFRRVFTRADPPARQLLAAHLDTGTAYWPLVNDLLAADPGRGQTIGDASRSGEPTGHRPAPPDEPLTERELTVLRYLQSVLSNVEIARELSVSVNTVKTHVRNIYRKLNTSRRRDAIRRAREWHLL